MIDARLFQLSQTLYYPLDVEEAWQEWGANCGPAALAAILRVPLSAVRPLLDGFEQRRYMNPTHLLNALRAAGAHPTRCGNWPRDGLAFIQIEGPWEAPGVPIGAAYRHTHTVAVRTLDGSRFVYDVNAERWLPFAQWEQRVMLDLLVANTKRATGYRVRVAYEVPQ